MLEPQNNWPPVTNTSPMNSQYLQRKSAVRTEVELWWIVVIPGEHDEVRELVGQTRLFFSPSPALFQGRAGCFVLNSLRCFEVQPRRCRVNAGRGEFCSPLLYLHRGKAILGEALGILGIWGSEDSRQSAYEFGKVISSTHRPTLHPVKYSWYLLLLEAESTPVPQCGRLDYVNEKFQWPHREIISTWRKIKFSIEIIIFRFMVPYIIMITLNKNANWM